MSDCSRARLLVSFFVPALLLPTTGVSVELAVRLVECDWVYRVTVETPSMKRVLNSTLALLNMPSLRDTTINWKTNMHMLNIMSLDVKEANSIGCEY